MSIVIGIISVIVIVLIIAALAAAARGTKETASNLYRKANPAAQGRYDAKMSRPRNKLFPLPGDKERERERAAEYRAEHVPASPEYRARHGSS